MTPRLRRLGRELGFHAVGLGLAVGAFGLAVPGLVLGATTVIVWVGLPVLAVTLTGLRWFATQERSAVAKVVRAPLAPVVYEPGRGRLAALGRPQAWRDLIHGVLGFPVRVGAAAVALGWTAVSLGTALFVTWGWALPRGDVSGVFGLVTAHNSEPAEVVVNTLMGVVGLVLSPYVVGACTWVRVGLARVLLTSPAAALREAAAHAEASRRASARAEQLTLSRVERDLHDGPQQRLVRLTMDLETARRRLDDDPAKAGVYVEEALAQSREALSELRALTRGLAPPVLAEQGLLAAVTAAAGRCPVEVTLASEITMGDRFDPETERAAYFLVAEALTNVAKHSGATHARVELRRDGDRLVAAIEDDGRGGAALGKGHGLVGLGDRIAGLGSVLAISSPVGGPTCVSATFEAAPEVTR